jgi:hypothetical protein
LELLGHGMQRAYLKVGTYVKLAGALLWDRLSYSTEGETS